MHKLYVRSSNTINMFHSASAVITFLLLAMMFAGSLVINGNFLVYAQEEEGVIQGFIYNGEYSYSTPQNYQSTAQPLEYFPTAITIPILPSSPSQQQQSTVTTQSIPPPSPQPYYQQSPSPLLPSSSPIQNVQLTQQITVEICSNGIDDDREMV